MAFTLMILILAVLMGISVLAALAFLWFKFEKNREPYSGVEIVYEGGGIRRGLSVVESAFILDLSDEVIVLLAFVSLLEKGFIEYEKQLENEVVFSVVEWLQTKSQSLDPTGRTQFRTEIVFSEEKILMSYENVMLELMEQNAGRKIGDLNYDIWHAYLEKEINEKLVGYDKKDTAKYYWEFIAHRMGDVWHSSDLISENILWYLCAYYDPQLKNENVNQTVEAFAPVWLPPQLNFIEFLELIKTKMI